MRESCPSHLAVASSGLRVVVRVPLPCAAHPSAVTLWETASLCCRGLSDGPPEAHGVS